ncbi:MAG: M48 family metallopeptidase [Eubacterium sp.]|nr:M48 family metallopeptidase [Eubacterium sp.]
MSIQEGAYKVLRSRRRTISIEVNRDLEVIVRAPRWVAKRDIRYFVDEKEGWIRKTIARLERERELQKDQPDERLTQEELNDLVRKAREVIPKRAEYYAQLIGVTYGRITIRHQKTRWGSCSARGNLNFNCLLMLAPPEVLDAIVVHELCHRKEMNHSERFYREVHRIYPDYDKWNRWLKDHGQQLQKKNPDV